MKKRLVFLTVLLVFICSCSTTLENEPTTHEIEVQKADGGDTGGGGTGGAAGGTPDKPNG